METKIENYNLYDLVLYYNKNRNKELYNIDIIYFWEKNVIKGNMRKCAEKFYEENLKNIIEKYERNREI